jgi:hypothetical protein
MLVHKFFECVNVNRILLEERYHTSIVLGPSGLQGNSNEILGSKDKRLNTFVVDLARCMQRLRSVSFTAVSFAARS